MTEMMQCPRHSRNRATGYCTVCGDLGCEECLFEHESQFYCERHYQPIREKQEQKKYHKQEMSKRERQRLVVHMREGEIAYGASLSLNTGAEGFYLELVDRKGTPQNKTLYVEFSTLKAVFYVKSYDGRFDPDREYLKSATGSIPLVVEFSDGEIMHGRTMRPYSRGEKRFNLVPEEPASNNISVLVEQAAVAAVYTPEEYEAKHHEDIKRFILKNRHDGETREELHGDFYFERHDYEKALRYYRTAHEESRQPLRIRKKILLATYNMGIRHIKRHEYEKALDYMRMVLELDPENERALKKVQQLQEALQKKHSS